VFVFRIKTENRLSRISMVRALLAASLTALSIYSLLFIALDPPRARMTYMYPGYRIIPSLSSLKYSIYEYHETNPRYPLKDYNPTSVAVLFLPGSAGSYGQVRSIASETTKLYWELINKGNEIPKVTFYTSKIENFLIV
jgi:glycosylphosphatidylinositol deacylase